jgi:hypothetical protein
VCTDAGFYADGPQRHMNGRSALDGAHRAVERDEKAIAQGFDFDAAKEGKFGT